RPCHDAERDFPRPQRGNAGATADQLAVRREDRRHRDEVLLLDIGVAPGVFERRQRMAVYADAVGEEHALGKWKHRPLDLSFDCRTRGRRPSRCAFVASFHNKPVTARFGSATEIGACHDLVDAGQSPRRLDPLAHLLLPPTLPRKPGQSHLAPVPLTACRERSAFLPALPRTRGGAGRRRVSASLSLWKEPSPRPFLRSNRGREQRATYGRAACVIRSLLGKPRCCQLMVRGPIFYARNSSPPCVQGLHVRPRLFPPRPGLFFGWAGNRFHGATVVLAPRRFSRPWELSSCCLGDRSSHARRKLFMSRNSGHKKCYKARELADERPVLGVR